MKIKFSELRKKPRGKLACPEANAIAMEAISKLKNNEDAVKLINDAELNNWFGKLVYPSDERPTMKIQFRRGVFQFMKIKVIKNYASFWITVINDNVDFSKE